MVKDKMTKKESANDKLTKGDRAMLAAARMQILLEKNLWIFNNSQNQPRLLGVSLVDGQNKILSECYDIIKNAKIPKKYLLAESLDQSTNKI